MFDEIYESMDFHLNKDIIEERTIAIDSKNNISIFCRPTDTKISGEDAYFKVFNSVDYLKATKVARICFFGPKYIIHKNRDGKENWNLKAKDKKILIALLNSKSSNANFDTIWEETIAEYNKCCPNDKIDINIPIPDYTKL